VGDNGTILAYDGVKWTCMASGTTVNLHGVWGDIGSGFFAVGDGGTILYSGGTVVSNFIASPYNGLASLTVNFTDQSSGAVTTWLWNFGDGSTNSTQNPAHVYSSPGTYTVSLTVSGPDGINTNTKANLITVGIPKTQPCECDLNGDGRCDMRDWLLFGKNWGRTNCP
jgi:PKD repeat protein